MIRADDVMQGQIEQGNSGAGGIARAEFWTDTCREVTDMRSGSKDVIELYRTYGCRFCVPSQGQVQNVLEALDSAMPQWEKEHRELFYQTLELNFPELVRHT
jgi:hypothetical protein